MKKFFAMMLAVCMMGTTVYGAEIPTETKQENVATEDLTSEEEQKKVMAKPLLQKVQIDREEVTLPGYRIDGYTYFRVRDVAREMTKNAFFKDENEDSKVPIKVNYFDVMYDEEENSIHLKSEKKYVDRGQEGSFILSLKEDKEAIPSEAEVKVDGERYGRKLQGYVIDGYTYYKLRDLGNAVNFPVDWCEEEQVIEIAASISMSAARKPVIYLYPKETTEVSVHLDYKGDLIVTYPAYNDGWKVTAQPDGTLTNHADGKEYSYLFWEGEGYGEMDFSEGFVVKGEDTVAFLQEKLSAMGMTPREYNEFIVYWLPYMQDNAYNLISFQWENYNESAKLNITPEPDNMLRVFMAFKALEEPVDIPEQKLPTLQREGFTVVEWGGTEM